MKTPPIAIGIFYLSASIMLLFSTHSAAAELDVKIAENLQRLLTTKECRNCDLSGVNLNRADLAGADLAGADLTGAKLYLSDLSGANLQNAILLDAGLGGADLSKADLRNAEISSEALAGAYTEGTLLGELGFDQVIDDEEIESILESGRTAGGDTGSSGSAAEQVQAATTASTTEESGSSPGFIEERPVAVSQGVVEVKGTGAVKPLVRSIEPAPEPKRIEQLREAVIW